MIRFEATAERPKNATAPQCSLAQWFSHSAAEAETAAQEIFVDIWKNAPRYEQAKCSEKIFVAMLARRRLVDRRRNSKQSFDQDVDMDALFRTLDNVVDDREACDQAGRVRKHLKKLPIDQARVLLLAIHHGMPHSQIAELTGLAEGTVNSHIRQGLLCLREVMTDPTTDQR